MNILVDLRKLSRKPSGIGIYIYQFIVAVMEAGSNNNCDSDHKINFVGVTDVMESHEINQLKSFGINIYIYGSIVNKNIDVFKYFSFINEKINEVKPDIFWEPNNVIPVKISNPYGKIMTTIHDIFPITSKENYGLIYRIYFSSCLRKTLKMSDSIIYVSDFTKKEVESRYKIANGKENYISYNIARNELKDEVAIDKNYFLYIGNIERRKGVDILIKAFNLYRQEGGTKKLFIAGSIRDHSIKAMMEESNKKYNAIEYKGYVTKEEKELLLKECSVFVFPSRAEGFGIPPLEAISYNKNCIVSDIDVFKEVFLDNVNYFELSKDMDKTVNNLKNQLLEFKDMETKRKILERYSSKTLGDGFVNFVNNLNMERLKND